MPDGSLFFVRGALSIQHGEQGRVVDIVRRSALDVRQASILAAFTQKILGQFCSRTFSLNHLKEEKGRITWRDKTIQRELERIAAEFEDACESGEKISRKEAAAIAEEQRRLPEEELARLAAEDAKIQTFRQFCETDYIPNVLNEKREHTRESYIGQLKEHIYPALGEIKLPDITDRHIDTLLKQLRADGKAHATVQKNYNIISAVMKHAYKKRRLIQTNPMDFVDCPTARDDEAVVEEHEAYTETETRYIKACIANEPVMWRALINVLIDTGMRRGECTGLKWEDIEYTKKRLDNGRYEYSSGTVRIQRTLCYSPSKGIYENPPKSKKGIREVYITPETVALIDEIKANQFSRRVISEYIFTQDNSPLPMHPDSPTRRFKKYGEKYGIEHFHPHKLRHTNISIMVRNGVDVATAGELAGHADKKTTLGYSHGDEDSRKRAAEIVQRALMNA